MDRVCVACGCCLMAGVSPFIVCRDLCKHLWFGVELRQHNVLYSQTFHLAFAKFLCMALCLHVSHSYCTSLVYSWLILQVIDEKELVVSELAELRQRTSTEVGGDSPKGGMASGVSDEEVTFLKAENAALQKSLQGECEW